VARNRQRAKQRQAERRARQGDRGRARQGDPARARRAERAVDDSNTIEPARTIDDPTTVEPSPAVDPELAVGAPPQDEGRSDTVFAADQAEEETAEEEALEEEALEEEALSEIEDRELALDEDGDGAEPAYAPRGRRGREEAARTRERSRVVQFLIAVWAELQRVQWPNRQALTTLTGVVLGFVLIAGGYLGLLDAIFSRIVQAIL
jgi:preprotein translocase subunit SecE